MSMLITLCVYVCDALVSKITELFKYVHYTVIHSVKLIFHVYVLNSPDWLQVCHDALATTILIYIS